MTKPSSDAEGLSFHEPRGRFAGIVLLLRPGGTQEARFPHLQERAVVTAAQRGLRG